LKKTKSKLHLAAEKKAAKAGAQVFFERVVIGRYSSNQHGAA